MKPGKQYGHAGQSKLEKRRTVFFSIGLLTAMSLSLIAFEWVTPYNEIVRLPAPKPDDEIIILPPTHMEKEVVKKKETKEEKIQKLIDEFKLEKDDKKETVVVEIPEPPTTTDTTTAFFDVGPGPIEIEDTNTYPVYILEELPEFPGGEIALIRYLAKETSFPGRDQGIDKPGVVFIEFVIDKTGTVIQASPLNHKQFRTNNMESEALRVIKGMPKWKPGKQNGKPVKVRLIQPFKFKLY